MKSAELRDLTIQELEERVKNEVLVYNKMSLNHSVTPLDKPSELTSQRKLVARLKTILREKQINESKEQIQE